jgi:hypothetical protein
LFGPIFQGGLARSRAVSVFGPLLTLPRIIASAARAIVHRTHVGPDRFNPRNGGYQRQPTVGNEHPTDNRGTNGNRHGYGRSQAAGPGSRGGASSASTDKNRAADANFD